MENLLPEDIVKEEEFIYLDIFEKTEPKLEYDSDYVNESNKYRYNDQDDSFSKCGDKSIAGSSLSEETFLDVKDIKKEEPESPCQITDLIDSVEPSYSPVHHSIQENELKLTSKSGRTSENKLMFCSACQYSTYFKKELIAHMKRKHECECIRKKPLTHMKRKPQCIKMFCKYCAYYTYKHSNLTSHIRNSHKPSDKFKLFCYYCKFSTKLKDNLMTHMKEKHIYRFTDHRCHCEICDFSTRFPANLERHHKNKHLRHLSTKAHLECTYCNFRCFHAFDMQNHMMKHQNEWRYCCYLCGYGAYKKYNLWRHTWNNHCSDLPEGSFDALKKCYYCKYTTDVKSNFLQHFLNNHYNMYRNREKYPGKNRSGQLFYCGLCSYSAKSNRTVILHIDVVHKNLRLFPCHFCDYSTYQQSYLRVHITSKHYNIYPYKCDSCKYASSYKKHLRRHIITQHINKKPRKNGRKKN